MKRAHMSMKTRTNTHIHTHMHRSRRIHFYCYSGEETPSLEELREILWTDRKPLEAVDQVWPNLYIGDECEKQT